MSGIFKYFKNNPVQLFELAGMIGGVIVWLATMLSVPEDLKILSRRVDTVEERVRILEQNLEKNNTKTDLILSAVYEIRGTMLKK